MYHIAITLLLSLLIYMRTEPYKQSLTSMVMWEVEFLLEGAFKSATGYEWKGKPAL